MAVTTLPSLTRTIDNAFMHTWFDMKPVITDQILAATPIWAALKQRGCMTPQVGGEFITRGVRYALPPTQTIVQGTVFTGGETEMETNARWTWRYFGANITRTMVGKNSDQQNQGPFALKNYVTTKLEATKEALQQRCETMMTNSIDSTEVATDVQGLNDLVPVSASRAAGTYGLINRPTTFSSDLPTVGNIWWTPKYMAFTANKEQNLVSDMKHLYNVIYNNQEAPNLIVTTQDIFELYEDFGLDAVQIVKNDSGGLVDLGFEVLRFKGKEMIWSNSITTGDMVMANTNYIELVYDPTVWFDMTEWKYTANQLERQAQIVCAANMVGRQPRRHGRLYT